MTLEPPPPRIRSSALAPVENRRDAALTKAAGKGLSARRRMAATLAKLRHTAAGEQPEAILYPTASWARDDRAAWQMRLTLIDRMRQAGMGEGEIVSAIRLLNAAMQGKGAAGGRGWLRTVVRLEQMGRANESAGLWEAEERARRDRRQTWGSGALEDGW